MWVGGLASRMFPLTHLLPCCAILPIWKMMVSLVLGFHLSVLHGLTHKIAHGVGTCLFTVTKMPDL